VTSFKGRQKGTGTLGMFVLFVLTREIAKRQFAMGRFVAAELSPMDMRWSLFGNDIYVSIRRGAQVHVTPAD